jgi:predicted O-methyltransferase YrrM
MKAAGKVTCLKSPSIIKLRLRLLLLKSQIRNRNFESCFGAYAEKYAEFFKWYGRALELDGDILEFGVASGGTTSLMAQRLLEGGKGKTIHSFDSFQGFNSEEFQASYSRGGVTLLSEKDAFKLAEFSLAYVQSKLDAFGFSNLVVLHPGFFQQTLLPFLEEDPGRQFCFALIDCDLDTSVKFCAKSIYNRMASGGVILFDDYASGRQDKPHTAYSPGVQLVVDEFVEMYSPEHHGFADGLYHFVKRE